MLDESIIGPDEAWNELGLFGKVFAKNRFLEYSALCGRGQTCGQRCEERQEDQGRLLDIHSQSGLNQRLRETGLCTTRLPVGTA